LLKGFFFYKTKGITFQSFILIILFLFYNLSVTAEVNNQIYAAEITNESLTLEECLDSAYQANPTLKAAVAQESVTSAGIIQAKTRINPKYNVELAPVETTYRLADISTTLQLGNKRKFRIQVVKNQLESTNATVRTLAWKIREDTAQAFFELAIAAKTLNIVQDYLKIANDLLDISIKKEKVGDVAYLDVLRAQTALAQVKLQLAIAEANFNQAKRKLNLIMGRAANSVIEITPPSIFNLEQPPSTLPDFEDLITEAKNSRPEYSQFKANIAVEDSKVKLANSAKWPDVVVGGGLSLVTKTRRSFLGENPSFGPEAYFQVPLTFVDHQQGPKAISQATIKQIEAQTIAFNNQVEQEVSLAYGNLEGTHKQLHIFLEDVLPKQKEILSLSQKSYELGFIDLTGAVTAQQTAVSSQISYLQAITTYFQSIIALERAVGKTLSFDFAEL